MGDGRPPAPGPGGSSRYRSSYPESSLPMQRRISLIRQSVSCAAIRLRENISEESQMRRLVLGIAVMLMACGSPTVPRSASTPSPGGSSSAVAAVQAETGAGHILDAPASGTATPGAAASTQADVTGTDTAASCTTSGAASSPGPTQIVSQAATDDTFTLTFDQGVSQFEATPQASPNFTADPSGLPVVLQGSAGVRIVLRGLHFPGDPGGPSSFMPAGSLVEEIRRIGDFEGVVTWAVGLRTPGCASATARGSTLTFRFLPLSGKGTGKG